MATKPVLITSEPGIKRDGTVLEGKSYIDGLWVRFQRGLPRKVGGYRSITTELLEVVRGMKASSSNGLQYLHMGGASYLYQAQLDTYGNISALNDRTPAGFSVSSGNLWQFEEMYDSVSAQNRLIAHAAPNLTNLDGTGTGKVWYGDLTASSVLTDTGVSPVSGGIKVLHPYLFKFGSDGLVEWSVANKPNDFAGAGSGSARICGSKLIVGKTLRGTSSGPGGLFWSTDNLIRASFVGGSTIWNFDTISDSTSILSSRSVIEYDGVYYWIGTDRFLGFNGVVQEIPNQLNVNWFFDNLNYSHRQKVFAFSNTRWGEIWWCFPFGNATECTHAIVYNVREKSWYDTQLPEGGRSSADSTSIYPKPILSGLEAKDSKFTLWQHETGVDKVDGTKVQPIRSYYETNELSMIESGESQSLRASRIEPDFVQSGTMKVTVSGRANARDTAQENQYTFIEPPTTGEDQTVPVRETRRLMRFRFESDDLGGDYQAGSSYVHVEPGDGRVTR